MNSWLTLTLLTLGLSGCGCGLNESADAGVELDAGAPDRDAGTRDAGRPLVDASIPDAGPAPVLKIRRVLPPRGATAGGTPVLIEGSGFLRNFASTGSQAKRLTSLKFASNAALDFQIIDDETIEVRTPPGSIGLASVSLLNPNGTAACSNCLTYFDELVVNSFFPKQAPLSGGTLVTFKGQGFTSDTQVLFGKTSSPQVLVVSDTELKALAPRASIQGPVDLVAHNKNGLSTQRRAFTYVNDIHIERVSPLSGPLEGGTTVVISGSGFLGLTSLKFGAQEASSFIVNSDAQATAVSPAVPSPQSVNLVAARNLETFTARNAFSYVDLAGPLALWAVYPHVLREGQLVTFVGQALNTPGLTFSLGGHAVAPLSASFSEATVLVPPRGNAPRISEASAGFATLSAAVTWGLSLSSVTPVSGPSSGGTSVAATGLALPPNAEVSVGALAAAQVSVIGETALSFASPLGGGGLKSDVVVSEIQDAENRFVLPNSFEFLEALSLSRVQPERGAVAGGTLVNIVGSGFGESTVVSFGAERAKDIKVIDSHTLSCRTPKGRAGVVDVGLTRLSEKDSLRGGFSYFEPRSISGGLSGGPLVGTINVSVLDSTSSNYGAPVPQANVIVGALAATPFQGTTDARGQIVFSDPSLVKAPLVTVYKEGFETVTVAQVNAENLTVFIGRTEGSSGSPSNGPPPPPASIISGRVTGFKSPRPLMPQESLVAHVFVAQTSLYGGPPFAGVPNKSREKWQLLSDGAQYQVFTGAGLRAVYAVLGILNSGSMQFSPVAMGVKRGITTSSDNPAVDEDIVINQELTLGVPITIDGPLTFPSMDAGQVPATNSVYGWLDLGAEGFIPNPNNWNAGTEPNSSVRTSESKVDFPNFPLLDGANFIFANEASGPESYPVSYYFRRQPGDLSQGVRIGPLLPPPLITAPTALGFNGTLSWSTAPGALPHLYRVEILKSTLLGTVTVWSIVLPGSENHVVLPSLAVDKLKTEEAGNMLFVVIYASNTPKFAYNQWTYDSLDSVNWSAYTISVSPSFVP
jgi:hypothetical protein